MEEMVDLLEHFFKSSSKFYLKEELRKALKIKGESAEEHFNIALQKLIEDGKILFEKDGYKAFPKNAGLAFGHLQINKSGTGFVHTDDGETILIENIDLNGALDGDNVIVYDILRKRKDYYHGKIQNVVKRKYGNVVFEVIGNGKKASLVPYNHLETINVNIKSNELKELIDGDIIVVTVGCENNDGYYDGTIKKIVGHRRNPNIDAKIILEKYNIPVDFPEEVMGEAKKLPKEVKPEDLIGRVDLRKEIIFTIDCDDTNDRDDAVGIRKLSNGNYLLKVCISHVSHYIKKDSLLFKEACKRFTSIYPATWCVPMLPHIISNGICSLDPHVDRLTKTVEMEISPNGEIVNYDIYDSVINSKIAMSYSKVNQLLNGENVPYYEQFREKLVLLNELNTILEKARNERNYINFDTPELKISKKDSNGFRFNAASNGLSGQIIENAMVITGHVAYSHYSWHTIPYRIHEAPNEEKVKRIISLLRNAGINVINISNINAQSLKKLIDSLGDSEEAKIAKEYILKSMEKARYDTNNKGHFALQYLIYGHFTSPIRRIIDLVFQMIIDEINKVDFSEEYLEELEKFLKEICEGASAAEIKSNVVCDEISDMLMAEEMENHIGEEFDVYITDINSHSLMVRTRNMIRGKVKIEDMGDDNYNFDYDRKSLVGKSSKHSYKIGGKMTVMVKNASKATQTIYFEKPKQKKYKIS